jgi:hypothetical protein
MPLAIRPGIEKHVADSPLESERRASSSLTSSCSNQPKVKTYARTPELEEPGVVEA